MVQKTPNILNKDSTYTKKKKTQQCQTCIWENLPGNSIHQKFNYI